MKETNGKDRRRIREPLLIVGSPRSGTTLLGDLLATHPDIAYWEEPRTIWSQGNAWRKDDRLEAEDLTPAIAERIDRRFGRFLESSGRPRFMEKTPSNTLRLPFIHALYPDARIIHLVRDGRAVVASMMEMLDTPPRPDRMAARLRETPWRDLLPLARVFLQDLVSPRWREGRKPFWGPRPPGWQSWLDLPVATMLARQWSSQVAIARNDLSECFEPGKWIEFRFEDLVSDPEPCFRQIASLTGLEMGDDFLAAVRRGMDPARIDRWRQRLDETQIAEIEVEAGERLGKLGYGEEKRERGTRS